MDDIGGPEAASESDVPLLRGGLKTRIQDAIKHRNQDRDADHR